jgi:ubiquinone/menaquinone biosynthesis C-methylase UbiE
MPYFKSEDEAVKAHEVYHIDTDREEKYFNPNHTGWARAQQLLNWVPDERLLILSLGCNSGGFERLVLQKKPGTTVYAVDVNPQMINLACQKGIIAKVARAENLPFKDGYFDVLIVSEILEHVFDVDKVVKEALRVLKNGGLIIGSVPHPRSFNAKKGIINHPYHTRIFTEKQLRNTLKDLNDLEIKNIFYNVPDTSNTKKIPQWMGFHGIK